VYGSVETHTWIQKAADLSGLGVASIRWIPTDSKLRMDVAALRRQLEADKAAGDVPCIVIGTGGSVSTGAVDPLHDIAAACRDYGAWFHVDGAYGGFAAAVPEAPDDLRGLSEADSVAVDPHKWLSVPVECGCAIVRDKAAMRDTFSLVPPYLRDDAQLPWFSEFGIQQTRGFRALKLWMTIQAVGADGYRREITRQVELARRLAEKVRGRPGLELLATGPLSVVCFRARPAEGIAAAEADALNRAVAERLQAEGRVFLTTTQVRDAVALRACIVSFRTQEADLDVLLDETERVARDLQAPA
jgi:glutamate/tyrosine decarboxylase-like PLP-dependent enzyme